MKINTCEVTQNFLIYKINKRTESKLSMKMPYYLIDHQTF